MRSIPIAMVVACLAVAGCGLTDDLTLPPSGPGCTADSECVPNGCCGEGTAAVHVSLAPDCSAVRCTTSCAPSQVQCDCGVPVCRDSRCAVARSAEPQCL